jgi:hypothetical protein
MRSIAGRALLIAWVCISATTGWAADKTEGLPGNDYIIGKGCRETIISLAPGMSWKSLCGRMRI